MATFGDRLRIVRTEAGLTQDELAERVDVSKSAISAWENNRDSPSFDKLVSLRSTLRVSLDALLLGDRADGTRVGEAMRQNYLAGSEPLSRDEVRMLRRFRALSERRQRALITFLGNGGE